MNDQQNMTSSKIGRAAKLVGTGAKIGGNYLKYYAKKSVLGKDDKEVLHEVNAGDIYESLSNLKGSALKVAQMLSMDKNILPKGLFGEVHDVTIFSPTNVNSSCNENV